MISLAYCENLCLKIRRNEIDNFEIISEGRKFGFLDFSNAVDFSQKKNILLRAVLEEILKFKDYSSTSNYEEMLHNTIKFLELGASKQTSQLKYRCSFVGCLFKSLRHRDYMNHMKSVHSTAESYRCSYQQKCNRNFDSFEGLSEHVKEDHSISGSKTGQLLQPAAPTRDVVASSCKCNMVSCGQKVFTSTKKLASHITNDHAKEPRCCIFANCEKTFNPNATSTIRTHFRVKHFEGGETDLKTEHKMLSVPSDHIAFPRNNENEVTESVGDAAMETAQEPIDNEEEEQELADDDTEDDDEQLGNERDFMMAYADFINRLINYKFIPITSVKQIAAEYLQQSHQSAKSREKVLRASLSKIPNISADLIEDIVRENQHDPFLKAQEELSSETKRLRFMEENFNLVKPREIVLNPEEVKTGSPKDVVHYIPILDAFKALVEDGSFINLLEDSRNQERRDNDRVIEDVKDGDAYRNSKYFSENPEALALMLYSDGVELTNPLASGKGKHKIVQVFWQVCDVPRHQRSTVDRLQLGQVFKEKLWKKYGYHKIFQNLLADLKILETEGIHVVKPITRRIKASLLLYSGDNLESHQVGGFSACFSSKDVCRFCHIQYNDLEDHIHNYDGDSIHNPWTQEEYDSHEVEVVNTDGLGESRVQSAFDLFNEFEEPDVVEEEQDEMEAENVAEDEEPTKTDFGLSRKCVLNELQAFHAVTSMPPDSLHDLMEGVIPQDLLGIIRILVDKSWFTLDQYNNALRSLKYSSQESSNKPQEVPKNLKVKKLPGKATSNWVHIRNFLVILYLNGWIQDCNDEALQLAIKLHEMTERITAEAFRLNEIETLDDVIIDFLDHRKNVFNDFPVIGRPKPKHHFITHYPMVIRRFGPPSSFWTGRYESKHR